MREVVSGIHIQHGYILLVEKKTREGEFFLPWGKVEDTDASRESALARELYEELFATIDESKLRVYNSFLNEQSIAEQRNWQLWTLNIHTYFLPIEGGQVLVPQREISSIWYFLPDPYSTKYSQATRHIIHQLLLDWYFNCA